MAVVVVAAKGTAPFTARSQIWRTFGGGEGGEEEGTFILQCKKEVMKAW